MEDEHTKTNLTRIFECLESSLNDSLARVLGAAHSANVISYNHTFRQIFLNRLAEDLWLNNPLHPERVKTSICDMPFVAVSSGMLRPLYNFSWGMSRNQAATIIQVFIM